MSNDEYKRILLQVIQELRDQGWTEEEIAECDIRITETDDKQYVGFNRPANGLDGNQIPVLNGNPPASWEKYATEEDTPVMVSDIMANTNLKYKIKGVYKH